MGRKRSFVIFLSIFLSIISTSYLHAEVKNVKDCLEGNEECEELDQQPTEEMENDNNELVGNDNIKPTSLALNFIKMILALLLVLALIYLILTFIKKRNRLFSNINVLENLGGITVGTNKSLQIVRIGSKIYLIGVGDNVEMLQEITDEEVIDTLLSEENTLQPTSFLQTILQRKSSHSNEVNKRTMNENFTSTLEDELNKLKEKRNEIIHNYNEKDDRHE